MRLNLGTITIDDETWERCKKHGYDRDAVRGCIVGNGEESLIDALDTTMFCRKCGAVGTRGNDSATCDHDWEQK